MAFDENNDVASFSNTGPFKAGAPGVLVAAMDSPNSVAFGTGTSFAAPNWSAGIAFLQSFRTSSNAVKMDKIIYKTADTTAQGNKIPNFNKAVIKAAVWSWW
jgi:subtilisin family serine protease